MNVSHRLFSVRLIAFIAFCIITIRLYHLQVRTSYRLSLLSHRNCLRVEKIVPPRGNIFDCQGQLIATNRPLIQIAWSGTGNKKFNDDQRALIEKLEILCKKPLIDDQELIRAEYQKKMLVLLEETTFEDLSMIIEAFPDHPNLELKTHFTRYYPHTTTACHVLGYLGSLAFEATGKMGLEKIFDNALRGISGQVLTTINAIGRHLQRQQVQPAFSGEPLTTTISLALSKAAEECLEQNFTGTILLMEAQTGALRVVVSNPSFDPNAFLHSMSTQQWHDLQKNHPFLNRAFSGQYPPASLFKLITIIAALEQHIITEDTTWNCQGSVEFCKRNYHCKKRTGHGIVTTQEALIQSCNVPLYEIGKRIKIDALAHYARLFGLGAPTTSMLPEKNGLVPTAAWKRAKFGKPWWPGETLSVTIGQSFYLVTPLQICCMFGALGEGYLVTPRIIEKEPIQKKQINLHKKTLPFIKDAMRQVILRGTGQRLNTLPNILIYGKTGTAQIRGLSEASANSTDLHDEHGSFAAHITYKNHPPVVLVVLTENTGSSIIAVEIAKNFLIKYCRIMDEQAR